MYVHDCIHTIYIEVWRGEKSQQAYYISVDSNILDVCLSEGMVYIKGYCSLLVH